ncbi:VWA domain-containing protein, partial [Candidatus Poribacteria bacterium]|nr:VWA domain-containing protein [Candidatus Poribacteria bacterium]
MNEDQVGVLGFDAKIKMEISPRTDQASLLHKVGELTPGGGTKMYPALKRAYELLKGVDAKQKHIVLLSDGKSDDDFIPLAKQIAADKITVTAIAIGDAAQALMKAIADAGKGNYTYVQNVSQLPRVFANEVRQTQKYMIQEPFQPVISEGGGAILAGIDGVPKLYGYIATSEKEHAEVYLRSPEEHPILAAWNYGLGRAVAFTSDVKPGWGADWIAWEKFGKFWGQVVNSVLPSPDGGADFDLTVSHRNGRGQVIIERSPSPPSPPLPKLWERGLGVRGEVENEETFEVRVARPDGEGESVELQRVTPTRYQGDFPIREPGVYLVTAQEKRVRKIEGPGVEGSAHGNLRRVNLVVSYPAEFAEFTV